MILKKIFKMNSKSNCITFLVKGSKPEPYTVTFKFDDESFIALCSCPAGEEGMHCKHRLNILSGDSSSIDNCSKEELSLVMESYSKSSLKILVDSLVLNEKEVERLKKESIAIKKKIAKYMF